MSVKKKFDLKSLVSAAHAGFRTKTVSVSEWDGVSVVLREPSLEGWGRWREIMASPEIKEGGVQLSISEETQRNIRADAVMFIDALLDEDLQPVFAVSELETVISFYGPVHARLLRIAMGLATSSEDAEKKS
ncbi:MULTISPECIES: phage tail assembly chaperone [Yersinia]|uniref:Phage tail protein n=1 Tax=Yersinia rochesterensis TaxID=1604335 RepID=A0A386HGG2_9GAMM|nr:MULTISPECIES: phage tail assembly chaperone [Yersinia]ELI8277708.1 phage tail protein [Yersinia enterocolitica]AYD44755.1 phage tail protein [Yersinia rochesterensis]ELW7389819.1 phage tail protein [Yersinia enterocolitica]MDN0112501.1 phage tail assembly chaperone [Yersinia mollaretii]PEH53412.1 phage tail protein [Yersinia kristensenii]